MSEHASVPEYSHTHTHTHTHTPHPSNAEIQPHISGQNVTFRYQQFNTYDTTCLIFGVKETICFRAHYLTSTGSAAKCRPSGVKSLFASTAPTFLSRSSAESTFSSEGGSSVPAAGGKSMLILFNHLLSPLCRKHH